MKNYSDTIGNRTRDLRLYAAKINIGTCYERLLLWSSDIPAALRRFRGFGVYPKASGKTCDPV
jgi:hypothetical protein